MKTCLILTLILAAAFASAGINAEETTVIRTHSSCPYFLANSSQGLVIVKLLKGAAPSKGDTLDFNLKRSSFSIGQNTSTGDQVKVWVDMIDNHSKVFMRYGQYCS